METIVPTENSVKNNIIIPTLEEVKILDKKHLLRTILWTLLGILFLCLIVSLIYQNGKNIYTEELQ